MLLVGTLAIDVAKRCYLRVVFCDVKLAGMRVKLVELKDEMDDCVQRQDFQRAAELKLNITELEVSRQSLLSETEPKTTEVRTEKVSVIVTGVVSLVAAVVILMLVQS